MKYVMLVCDTLSDEPLSELGGRTPLEAAKTPNMDRLAKKGRLGLASFTPHRLSASADIACLSVLGYDPEEFYTGVAPLEAVAMGIHQSDQEIAFRCDLVTVLDDYLVDRSASRISPRESHSLVEELNKKIGSDRIRLHPGQGYKNMLLIRDPELAEVLDEIECTPPWKCQGQKYEKFLPKGQGASVLMDLMEKSKVILANHEINRVRIDLGENPANMIWPWGQGKRPKLPAFAERYKLEGAYISSADFVKGLGVILGLKAEKDLAESIKKNDFVFAYAGGHDEGEPSYELSVKIKRIEDFDSSLVGPAAKALEHFPEHRILVATDCAMSIEKKNTFHGRVPFLMEGAGITPDESESFSEKQASQGKFIFDQGHRLMGSFIA